jgi:hypothetical protein
MKVYSLYYDDTFVVAFPTREDAIQFGKKHYEEYSWECNIIEEYLSKTPFNYNPYPLTTPGPNLPYITHPPVISKPFPEYDDGRVKITYNDGIKA